jgi:uncharacterized membrane protein YhaH (DUF805 family)
MTGSAAPTIPFGYWRVVFSRYGTFTGRARRAEYWSFLLAHAIIALGLYLLDVVTNYAGAGAILLVAYAAAALVPGVAVAVRRLHDSGRSGWWFLLLFVPLAHLVLLVFLALDSQPGSNEYGPNPKTGQGFRR